MTVKTRQDLFNCNTKINTKHIVPISKLVSSITGFPIQPNKAIVGANAFAHESGIHQDGVLKHRETYEIMLAQDVGWDDNKIVLGKHSGRNALKTRLNELGYDFTEDNDLNKIFDNFKKLADIKHEIYDDDLHTLVSSKYSDQPSKYFKLINIQSSSNFNNKAESEVIIFYKNKENKTTASGRGS